MLDSDCTSTHLIRYESDTSHPFASIVSTAAETATSVSEVAMQSNTTSGMSGDGAFQFSHGVEPEMVSVSSEMVRGWKELAVLYADLQERLNRIDNLMSAISQPDQHNVTWKIPRSLASISTLT